VVRVDGGVVRRPAGLDCGEAAAHQPVEDVVDPLTRQACDPCDLGARRTAATGQRDVGTGFVPVEAEVQEERGLGRLIHQSIVTTERGFANASAEQNARVPLDRRSR
jgi:hypothetical protein